MDGWSYYIKKRVYIILKNKRVYSGIIYAVENVGNGISWITLIDKYGMRITISTGEVDLVEEEK
jgi:hypothetical protein